jgi:excisionase family DNA binding protein
MEASDSFGADSHEGETMQRLMTIKEVADYLRLSKVTVYKMTREGKIPASKIGKQWRYNKTEIDSWVKQKSNSKHH